jgi:hypothetical protein
MNMLRTQALKTDINETPKNQIEVVLMTRAASMFLRNMSPYKFHVSKFHHQ